MSYAHAQNNERLLAERQQFEREWEATTRQRGHKVGRIELSDRGLHQGGRVAIRPEFVTQSRDGKPLAPLLGDYFEYDGGITSFMHFPLIWYVISNDYALSRVSGPRPHRCSRLRSMRISSVSTRPLWPK